MTFTPATLELAEELFGVCNYGGTCKELAVCILTSGGQEQLFCCYEHGLIGTEADRVKLGQRYARMPGTVWFKSAYGGKSLG